MLSEYQLQSEQQQRLCAALSAYPQLVIQPGNPPIQFELMGKLDLVSSATQDKLRISSLGVHQLLSVQWSEVRLAQLSPTGQELWLSNGNHLILSICNPDGHFEEIRSLLGLMQNLPRYGKEHIPLKLDQDWFLDWIHPEDRSAYLLHLNNPAIYRYTLNIPYPYLPPDADQWMALVDQLYRAWEGPTNLAIRNPEGALCGGIGIMMGAMPHQAELGYWLAEPFWGQGLMSQAVKIFCPWALERFQLKRISAHIFKENLGSERVLLKCGFKLEGSMTHRYLKDGVLYDGKLFALTP